MDFSDLKTKRIKNLCCGVNLICEHLSFVDNVRYGESAISDDRLEGYGCSFVYRSTSMNNRDRYCIILNWILNYISNYCGLEINSLSQYCMEIDLRGGISNLRKGKRV